MRPWKAVGSQRFCRNIDGAHRIDVGSHREAVDLISADLAAFRTTQKLDDVVMINLASTERQPNLPSPALATADAFERALDADDLSRSPARAD
jgi:myo-inositol-1-phosphate synthase